MFGKEKRPPKILMVEDNRTNHPLFINAFEAAGFAVFVEQNAEEGFLDIVADIQPDIISMDIMIGKSGADLKVGGLEALEQLKADERTKNIPVMMLSSFFEEGKVQRSKEIGAVDYVNLQGNSITAIPRIFKKYLDSPKEYAPTHPLFRA